jgi:hypothetical protein
MELLLENKTNIFNLFYIFILVKGIILNTLGHPAFSHALAVPVPPTV